MIDIKHLDNAPELDQPRRIRKYVLVWCSSGSTEANLNELSKLHTGRTARDVMHGLTASEAKRLFRYERLSVKEVAYELGFNDPFYFSNFFKKQTRQSPKAYKEKHSI
jgi:AraC-like DNA-binding protein